MKSKSNFLQASDLSMALYLLAKHMLRQSEIVIISETTHYVAKCFTKKQYLVHFPLL